MIKRILISLFSIIITASTGSAEEDRPKIGLVLGGGGALGLAHVGVIEVLEELQIPIDYIGGTSMGAIVGGMYASGMSPEEMKQRFIQLNWWDVLKDRSSNQYLTYRRKFENKRYMGAEFGLKDWRILFSPGMSYGQKLNNVLETFALNSAGITDFDQLNIPYRAVATDLRAGESVTLKSGSLAQAMRASMAVPGVFTPVFMGDNVFVDGGIFNNIPVDVVREMGADIIIAVDVGESSATKSAGNDFHSLGEVVARTYTIMQRPGQVEQLKHADIVIAPDMTDSTSSHFHKAKMIIPKGRKGAEKVSEQLEKLSVNDAEFAAFLKKQRAQHTGTIEVTDVALIGNSSIPEQAILPHIESKPGPLERSRVYEDLNRIHGLGHFQTVTFDLEPNDEGYELTYNMVDKFWGPQYLHFGLKFETSTDATLLWSILLNYTHMQLNKNGGELRIDLEGGGYKRLVQSEWYQPLSKAGYFFVAPSIILSDEDIDLYDGNDVIADIDQTLTYGQFDIGYNLFEYGEFRMGLLGGHAHDEGNSGLIPLEELSDTVVAATTQFRLDQLDDPVFPTKGYQFSVDGLFASEDIGSSQTFNRLDAKAMKPFSFGRHTLIPSLSLGSSLGTELPFYSIFNFGGENTFAGYAPYQLIGNYYGIGSIGYRYRMGQLPPTLGNGVFAMTRFDAGNAWFDSDDIALDDLSYGALVGVAADTILGTCVFSVGKANDVNNVRFYFSLGNHF